jgi:hypothetical protein
MAHFLTSDERYRGLIYDHDFRSYLVAKSTSAAGYRFARTEEKRPRVGARRALGRFNGYLKRMVEAIGSAKLRRMERELKLRGVGIDRSDEGHAARQLPRAGH